MDVVSGASNVVIDDADELVVKLNADHLVVTGRVSVSPDRFEKPQRRVHRVVIGRLAFVGETVWDHTLGDVFGKFENNTAGDLGPLCRECQPR